MEYRYLCTIVSCEIHLVSRIVNCALSATSHDELSDDRITTYSLMYRARAVYSSLVRRTVSVREGSAQCAEQSQYSSRANL